MFTCVCRCFASVLPMLYLSSPMFRNYLLYLCLPRVFLFQPAFHKKERLRAIVLARVFDSLAFFCTNYPACSECLRCFPTCPKFSGIFFLSDPRIFPHFPQFSMCLSSVVKFVPNFRMSPSFVRLSQFWSLREWPPLLVLFGRIFNRPLLVVFALTAYVVGGLFVA